MAGVTVTPTAGTYLSETEVGISAQLDVDVEMRTNVIARDSPHKARSAGRCLEHGCLDWIVGSFRSVGYDGSSNKAKKIEENQRGSPRQTRLR
jgi:hypothetical protein